MNKPPAYQRYPKDWLASATRKMMSKPCRSAYTDLMDYCWDGGCKLPDDPEQLRIMADCTAKEWKQFGAQILRNFVKHSEGFITNAKLLKQWRDRKSFVLKCKRAGKASWKARTSVQRASNSASASASASAVKDKTYSDVAFESFWSLYPEGRKIGKPAALRAWKKVKADLDVVVSGLDLWKRSGQWEQRDFIPYPATFLNQRRWEDIPGARQIAIVSPPEAHIGTGPEAAGVRVKPEALKRIQERERREMGIN